MLEIRRLVSVMNLTKWRKLVQVMAEFFHLEPLVRVKYLHEDEAPSAFAPIWWSQQESAGFEWIDTLPIKETRVCLLAQVPQANYADLLQEAIDRGGIPYEKDGSIYRIAGYITLH